MLQDVSVHFWTLCVKVLRLKLNKKLGIGVLKAIQIWDNPWKKYKSLGKERYIDNFNKERN